MDLTEHHDLRTGSPVWSDHAAPPPCDPLPSGKVDVAIVGAGIMGAMLADALAASGRNVALVDRRAPASGSTAASTALVMWEIDTPLTHLAKEIGLDAAGARWRRVFDAVERLQGKVAALGQPAQVAPIVYLAGTLLDADGLRDEAAARARFGLRSEWHDAGAIADRFGIAPRVGLVSGGSFPADPVTLTLALLERARAAGVSVTWPIDVTRLETRADAIALIHDDGEILADRVILAGGYERASLFLPPAFSLLSSYAIATAPGVAPKWREDAMIWEASDPYLYTRTDPDGRIIAGGEDEDFAHPEAARDRRIEEKSGTIAAKLAALLDVADIAVDRRWAATFGASPDGLPAIGRAANHDRLWLASGFGGNGISFAALAAELLLAEFDGTPDPVAGGFDPYRFG